MSIQNGDVSEAREAPVMAGDTADDKGGEIVVHEDQGLRA